MDRVNHPATDRPNISVTGRIAGWSARHRWWVIAASLLVMFLAVYIVVGVGTETRDDDEGVGESGKAVKLMDERFRSGPAPGVVPIPTKSHRLIFSNPSLDVDNPLFRSTVDSTIRELRSLPHVTSAASYYDTDDPNMVADDRNAVLGWVTVQDESVRFTSDVDSGPVLETVDSAAEEADGFEIGVVSFGLIDDQFEDILEEDFGRILFISLGLGLVILLLAFRAVVAAIVPLTMAVGAIFTAIGVATLVSRAYPLVELYSEMILLMGLAVGIDYSLFILSRFRSELGVCPRIRSWRRKPPRNNLLTVIWTLSWSN